MGISVWSKSWNTMIWSELKKRRVCVGRGLIWRGEMGRIFLWEEGVGYSRPGRAHTEIWIAHLYQSKTQL